MYYVQDQNRISSNSTFSFHGQAMELEEFRQDVLKRIRHQRGMPETKADTTEKLSLEEFTKEVVRNGQVGLKSLPANIGVIDPSLCQRKYQTECPKAVEESLDLRDVLAGTVQNIPPGRAHPEIGIILKTEVGSDFKPMMATFGANRKPKKAKNCGQCRRPGHNSRTCPENTQKNSSVEKHSAGQSSDADNSEAGSPTPVGNSHG
ncbi:hypothetical protein B0H13DRAFT_1909317 [Mycena leptocephala]|nr:hypothetical protein B0H13DRAFT_1909317 [Mycena leptocephala]